MPIVTMYDEITDEYYIVEVENEDVAFEIECGCR